MNWRVIGVSVVSILLVSLLLGCSIGGDDPKPQEREEENDSEEETIAELEEEVENLRGRLDEFKWLENSAVVDEGGNPKAVVYFGLMTESDVLTVPVLRTLDGADDFPRQTLSELISGPQSDVLSPILPPDTEILSLEISEGIAIVDLSSQASTYATGSAGETMVIAGIVNTLTEFPQIDRVQIMLDGRSDVSLGGHYTLEEPIDRFDDAIPR